MAEPTTTPLKPSKKKTRSEKTVTCQVCYLKLPRLTADHARTHGLSLVAYSRIYSPAAPPSALAALLRRPGSAPSAALLDDATRAKIAERLLSDPDFIFRLADEVSDVLATGPIRDRVRLALGATVESRIALQGTALSQLSRAYEKLKEPWRLEQAEQGGPVSTEMLLKVIGTLGQEVSRGEDLVLRAGRLILEEQRSRAAQGLSTVDATDRFKGGDDNIPLPPPDTTPEERENMRIMLSQVSELFARSTPARIIDAKATVSAPALPAPPSQDASFPSPSAGVVSRGSQACDDV